MEITPAQASSNVINHSPSRGASPHRLPRDVGEGRPRRSSTLERTSPTSRVLSGAGYAQFRPDFGCEELKKYIQSLKTKALREELKKRDLPVYGNKETLIVRLLTAATKKDAIVLDIPSWFLERERNSERNLAFSVHEFGRLLHVLKEENVRRSLLASVQPRSRVELDRGLARDHFWASDVEPMFNDEEYQPERPLRMPIELDDVSPALAPPCFRSGEVLKKHYRNIRAIFTKHYQNWSRSGQNDPDNFLQFTTPADSHGLAAVGKKKMYLFHILQCGTPEEDRNLIEVILRTMPEDCQVEEGLQEFGETGDAEEIEEGTTPSRSQRKRRKVMMDKEFSESVALSFQESSRMVAEAIRESSGDSNGAGTESGFLTEKLQKFQETQAQLGILQSLADIDKTLKESGASEKDPIRGKVRKKMLKLLDMEEEEK